ncbi:asparagine synthase [candidate division KSB1 bacterium]|nr:asparagine synthase [candidate division KSB1 bacterium]
MIGGCVFRNSENSVLDRLNTALEKKYSWMQCCENGIIFYDIPFADDHSAVYSSDNLIILTQDLLVGDVGFGDYARLDIKDFAAMFRQKKTAALHDIVSDYRMIIIEKTDEDTELYLVSNRAGNGRIYYYQNESGLLFSSDFRFLLKIIPFDVNDLGIYAILKYGAIPEPLTINTNVKAVPAAHYFHMMMGRNSGHTHVYFQFEFPCDEPQNRLSDLDETLQPAKQELRKSAKFLRQFDPAVLISGGIDSSLYASYMNECEGHQLHGLNCTFGENDPEFEYARMLAEKIGAQFYVGKMEMENALSLLHDTVTLTGHPFSDFSSLPIVFILKYMKEHVKDAHMLIEGNGADDCFGFPALTTRSKMQTKQRFPRLGKDAIALLFRNSTSWKWLSNEGYLARVLALADSHEINLLNNFLVLSPINFLHLNTDKTWDTELTDIMDGVYNNCTKEHDTLSFEAKTTVRQLLHINSRRWAAKAFSVGESLGIRVIYPFIWRDVLTLQGSIPWEVKTNNGIVKWPLKRLLEDFMPAEFIYRKKSGFVPPFVRWLTFKDFNSSVREILLQSNGAVTNIVPAKIITELLDDALAGRDLRHSILNFLWGALFTEMWIQRHTST